jgi:hypothetical protein
VRARQCVNSKSIYWRKKRRRSLIAMDKIIDRRNPELKEQRKEIQKKLSYSQEMINRIYYELKQIRKDEEK